jgi:hypothetical protein
MVRPATALAASPMLTHILLNSGESRCYLPKVSDRCALRLTRTLIRRGGVVISRPLGTYATLHHGRGGLVLTLEKDALPLIVSALALDPGGSDLWRWLVTSYEFFRANVPGYQTANPPMEPEATPWLATLDLPSMAVHVSPQMAERLRKFAGEVGMALTFGGAAK